MGVRLNPPSSLMARKWPPFWGVQLPFFRFCEWLLRWGIFLIKRSKFLNFIEIIEFGCLNFCDFFPHTNMHTHTHFFSVLGNWQICKCLKQIVTILNAYHSYKTDYKLSNLYCCITHIIGSSITVFWELQAIVE